jgi:hypothetical protein
MGCVAEVGAAAQAELSPRRAKSLGLAVTAGTRIDGDGSGIPCEKQ